MMKRIALCLVILATASVASAEMVEAIVARVGDRIITRSEYIERLRSELKDIENTAPPERIDEIKKQRSQGILDDMISELLIRERADQIGITVSDQEVRQSIERLKDQYGIKSDEDFEQSLEQAGMSRTQMEARLRETLRSNKLFGRELRARAQLTDRELRKRYDREKERYRLPERAKVREIIILIPEDADAPQIEELEARAKRANERALAGEPFESLVAEYSEAPSKEQGGDIGIVSKGELLPALDGGVFSPDATSIVGPIRTRFGFHILSVDERLPSEIPAFDEIKERLREEESEAAFQRDLDAYLENLKNEALVVVHEDQIPTLSDL